MRLEMVNPTKPSADPEQIILMSTTLGGYIMGRDGKPGDALNRGQRMADAFDAPVLLNSRVEPTDVRARRRYYNLGLPRSLDAQEFSVRAAEDAAAITSRLEAEGYDKLRLISFDASAGASYRLAMLESGRHPAPKTICLFDPNAMKDYSPELPGSVRSAAALGQWAAYQITKELWRPDASKGDDPMDKAGKAPVNAIDELAIFADVWTCADAYRTLGRIAGRQLCEGSHTRLTIPEHTFTLNPKEAVKAVSHLTTLANQLGVNFLARVAPGMYHSATVDPDVCIKLLQQADDAKLPGWKI